MERTLSSREVATFPVGPPQTAPPRWPTAFQPLKIDWKLTEKWILKMEGRTLSLKHLMEFIRGRFVSTVEFLCRWWWWRQKTGRWLLGWWSPCGRTSGLRPIKVVRRWLWSGSFWAVEFFWWTTWPIMWFTESGLRRRSFLGKKAWNFFKWCKYNEIKRDW